MGNNDKAVYVDSEIGRLRKVVIHSPGREIETMTPKTAEEVLYNDIIPLSVVSAEHRVLKELLSAFCTVYEVTELLEEIIKGSDVRGSLVDDIVRFYDIGERKKDLLALSASELISVLISGLKEKKNSLVAFLSHKIFDIPPLPNLYFTRDSAVVISDRVLLGAMANAVRSPESLFMRYIFTHHTELRPGGFVFDMSKEHPLGITVEGGDIVIVSRNTLAIGVSERTTAKAVDEIASCLVRACGEPLHVFAVIMEKERAFIHLDMVFTMLDRDIALVHEPCILGKNRFPVYRLDVFPGEESRITRVEGLLEGLSEVYGDVSPVVCGGKDPVLQEREQWFSGTNFFAVAPGKVVGYDCNTATLESLSNAGFEVRHAEDFISGRESLDGFRRVAIGISGLELARGGGGIRCMTLPVLRDAI